MAMPSATSDAPRGCDALRGPALLAAAEAAAQRGESARALEALDQAAQAVPRAARVLRARALRRDGKPAEALALLAPEADSGSLTPGGWRELVLAALASGDTRRARESLAPLQKSARARPSQLRGAGKPGAGGQHRGGTGCGRTEHVVVAAAEEPAPHAVVVDAYARRAAALGMILPAMDELDSALRREWSSSLVETWGALGSEDLDARLRRAEGWLDAHPNDAGLLLALGRMCVRLGLWGKARKYLERSLALSPSAGAWEALAEMLCRPGRCRDGPAQLSQCTGADPRRGGAGDADRAGRQHRYPGDRDRGARRARRAAPARMIRQPRCRPFRPLKCAQVIIASADHRDGQRQQEHAIGAIRSSRWLRRTLRLRSAQ